MNKKHIAITIVITALITASAVFYLLTFTAIGPGSGQGFQEKGIDNSPGSAGKEKKIIYWRAPMDPMEIYDEPGKSKMGMDLVPVYEEEAPGKTKPGERKIAYWKAPMDPTEIHDAPGKSNMGMDLIPVYEDELVGGVDIAIDAVVEQNMGLKTETVERGPLNHTIQTYGHITYDETRTGIVSQKAPGWIEKLYADYTGFYVKKGQPLYEIYSPSLLASQEEYLSAYRNYQKHKTALNSELLASAVKRLHYFDIAEEEIAAIEKTGVVQKRLTIRSPYQGFVTHKNVIEGAYVKPGAGLFTISDLSTVWVKAHIFEYEQNLVHLGQDVVMTLSYNPGKIYRGKISYIFPYLQPKTRDITIRIAFNNREGELKPDMFARIKIDTDPGKIGILISSQAIIHSGEEQLVFVSGGKGKFTPRKITTGAHLKHGKVEVLSGLAPGETIVVSGQFLLDSESKLREAIQKMIESKSPPATPLKKDDPNNKDDFFNDMTSNSVTSDAGKSKPGISKPGTSEDDFFKDME